METFKEIVELAKLKGFIVQEKPKYYSLTFERKDGIKIELSIPDDSLPSKVEENDCLIWEFKLVEVKSDLELYKRWDDIYGGTAAEKINDLKDQLLKFINSITTPDIRIMKKSIFSILGIQFFKYKALQIRLNDKWIDYDDL